MAAPCRERARRHPRWRDELDRDLEKVISEDRSVEIKKSFFELLEAEPGIWPSAHAAAEFPWSAAAGR